MIVAGSQILPAGGAPMISLDAPSEAARTEDVPTVSGDYFET